MSYTDWEGGLSLIPNKEQKVILELGLGMGTAKLLSNFRYVYSFECYKDNAWYNKCCDMYKNEPNWIKSFLSFDSIGMDIADKQLLQSDGKVRDDQVLQLFLQKLTEFVTTNIIDVAFVDQGFHMRGECVNFFLDNNVPIVMAHDYRVTDNNLYGWNLIKPNSNYTQKLYESPLGLNIWFRNDILPTTSDVV